MEPVKKRRLAVNLALLVAGILMLGDHWLHYGVPFDLDLATDHGLWGLILIMISFLSLLLFRRAKVGETEILTV